MYPVRNSEKKIWAVNKWHSGPVGKRQVEFAYPCIAAILQEHYERNAHCYGPDRGGVDQCRGRRSSPSPS